MMSDIQPAEALVPAAYDTVLETSFRDHYARGADVWTEEGAMRAAGQWAVTQVPKEQARILDLGIGRGRDAEVFCRAGHRVTGLDLIRTPEIDDLERSYSDRMDMRIGHARHVLPVLRRYDLIFDNGCFHHQLENDYDDYLRRIRESLAPGGRLAVSVFTPPDPQEEGRPWTLPDGRLTRMFNPAELGAILERNGFDVLATQVFPRGQPGKADYLGVLAQASRRQTAPGGAA